MIDFLKSNGVYQEKIAEYAFLRDLLLDGVRNGIKVLVSRSDFDAFGYDVLVQSEGSNMIKKIQLKAANGKADNWDVHKSIIADQNSTIVLTKLKEINGDIEFEYYALIEADREKIINRPPKKPHYQKCKINKGELTRVQHHQLFETIMNNNLQI